MSGNRYGDLQCFTIKGTCHKIFNHGVLYNIFQYSPMSVIKLNAPLEKREAKFLELYEIGAFFDILSKTRNSNYYDLAIVVLFQG